MCGRATLSSPAEDIAEIFEADPIDIGPPRFNIAPTQPILTVRQARPMESSPPHDPASSGSGRELTLMRWGLIPWWAKPDEAKKIASRCIQARAETAPNAPAFRDAFKRHRCLVVVDGFFEWKTLPDGRRIPHHVHRKTAQSSDHPTPFAIAALWDSWNENEENRIESCAVLTTRSGGALHDLHDRMPLVLPANDWNTWLGGTASEAALLLKVEKESRSRRADELVAIPVSTWVNDVRHDDPRCIEPAPIPALLGQISFSFDDEPKKASVSARPKAQARRRK